MNFRSLQDSLRRLLLARIAEGEFTGLSLAGRVGFQQAHISNFLNSKRSLSLDAMDQVLRALDLSILDLVDNAEIDRRATETGNTNREFESVPLVDLLTAATARAIPRDKTIDLLKFKKNFLRRLRTDAPAKRKDWTRFVLVKADASNADAMYPRLLPGATLLLDRHYTSLNPYRRAEQNMYCVRKGNHYLMRYVALHGNQLSLRPHGDSKPLDFLLIPSGAHFSDFIIGRICHVGMET